MTARESLVSKLPEASLSVFIDSSEPLLLKIQLFWFEQMISDFLAKRGTLVTEAGPVITHSDSFKYVPFEMADGKNLICLEGFESNATPGAYNQLVIRCETEEEKLLVKRQIRDAFLELVEEALENDLYPPGSSARLTVGLVPNP